MDLKSAVLRSKSGAQLEMKKLKDLRKNILSKRFDQFIDQMTQQIQPDSHSGQIGWTLICKKCLYGIHLKSWNTFEEPIQFNNIDVRSHEIKLFLFPAVYTAGNLKISGFKS